MTFLDGFVPREIASEAQVRTIRTVAALHDELATARTDGRPLLLDSSTEWGLMGAPAYIVASIPRDAGPNYEGFKRVAADVRPRSKK